MPVKTSRASRSFGLFIYTEQRFYGFSPSNQDQLVAKNQLILVTQGTHTTGYEYDGDGNRTAKIVDGTRTDYVVDDQNPTGYAQVLAEIQGGQVVKRYTYGHDLISQEKLVGSDYVASYYVHDGTGSVRALTDSNGAITDTYTFDAFGTLLASTGTTDNEFLFQGERKDPETGLYYLRARYMDPAIGRFTTMDGYEGDNQEPKSSHKYLFTQNNPLNKLDPSGYEAVPSSDDSEDANTINNKIKAKDITAKALPLHASQAVLLPPTKEDIIKNKVVLDAIGKAWRESNPYIDDNSKKSEQGGWIYVRPSTWSWGTRRAEPLTNSHIDLRDPPILIGGWYIVGTFHTHPNLGTDPGAKAPWEPFPSDADNYFADEVFHVPGIIRTHIGILCDGTIRRKSFSGSFGFPSE